MSTPVWPCMEEKVNEYSVLVGKPARRRPLEKSKCKCKYNIKMDLK